MRRSVRVAVLAAVAVAVPGSLAVPQAVAAPPTLKPGRSKDGASFTVNVGTGDRLVVGKSNDGSRSVSLERRPGREGGVIAARYDTKTRQTTVMVFNSGQGTARTFDENGTSVSPRKTTAAGEAQVTVKAMDRDGKKTSVQYLHIYNIATGRPLESLGSGKYQGDPGRYLFEGHIETGKTAVSLFQFERELRAGAQTVTLDARDTKRIQTTTDMKDAVALGRTVSVTYKSGALDGWTGIFVPDSVKAYVFPTKNAGQRTRVSSLFHKKGSTWKAPSPYLIRHYTSFGGGVPAGATLNSEIKKMAKRRTSVRALVSPSLAWVGAGVMVNGDVQQMLTTQIRAPFAYTEYLTPGRSWRSAIALDGEQNEGEMHHQGYMVGDPMVYEVGKTYPTEKWYSPVMGPSANPSGTRAFRRGKWLEFAPRGYLSDATPGHWGDGMDGRGRLALSRDGTEVAAEYWPNYELTAEVSDGTYSITAAFKQYAKLSQRVDSEWTFTMPPADGDKKVQLPLLNVRYAPSTDTSNRGKNGVDTTLPIWVDQFGSPVKELTVEVSYDDGTTWTPLTVTPKGSRWEAAFKHSSTAEYVSLRGTAKDEAGNSVTQTIIRAYALKK